MVRVGIFLPFGEPPLFNGVIECLTAGGLLARVAVTTFGGRADAAVVSSLSSNSSGAAYHSRVEARGDVCGAWLCGDGAICVDVRTAGAGISAESAGGAGALSSEGANGVEDGSAWPQPVQNFHFESTISPHASQVTETPKPPPHDPQNRKPGGKSRLHCSQ